MNCSIYKGSKKYDAYLYVEKQDDFSRVPDVLLKMMGKLEFVMTIDLRAQRKLAQADVEEVIAKLDKEGFYLQMPKKDYIEFD
jgi:uncharacterized protein YcgL (UPF0745 family)